MNLYAVYFDWNDAIVPIIHNVDRATARSIRRHYNKLIGRSETMYCGFVSQEYCLNWCDFI